MSLLVESQIYYYSKLLSTLESGINECDGSYDCEQSCVVTNGSFQCACRHGYFLALNEKGCQGCKIKLTLIIIHLIQMFLVMQMLMSVLFLIIIVMKMLDVIIQMEVIYVYAMKDTMAMAISALVSNKSMSFMHITEQ